MLLANYSQLNTVPGKGVGGFTNPYQWMKVSSAHSFYIGNHVITGVTDRANFNTGYRPPYAYILAPKSGELAAINSLLGEGNLTLNLAGGINIQSTLGGTSLLTASISALGKIASTLAGSGDFTAGITGSLNAIATLLGQGDLTAALGILVGIESQLTGTSSLTGEMIAALGAQANLSGNGQLVSAITGSLNAIAVIVGTGRVEGDVIGAWPMITNLSGTGNLVGDLEAIANMVSGLAGVATFTITSSASAGDMQATINIGASTPLSPENLAAAVWNALANDFNAVGTMGEKMNDAGSGANPWTEVIEGSYTAADLLRLLTAVAAGKSTIVDLGGGLATVTFRDINDTENRVIADMTNSERTNVTIDVT